MKKKNNDPPDIVELIEEDVLTVVDPEPIQEAWLGHHEPDYSLVPDRVIPLSKEKYPTYGDALLRFAEIAKTQRLRLHKHFEDARNYIFEVFYILEEENAGEE